MWIKNNDHIAYTFNFPEKSWPHLDLICVDVKRLKTTHESSTTVVTFGRTLSSFIHKNALIFKRFAGFFFLVGWSGYIFVHSFIQVVNNFLIELSLYRYDLHLVSVFYQRSTFQLSPSDRCLSNDSVGNYEFEMKFEGRWTNVDEEKSDNAHAHKHTLRRAGKLRPEWSQVGRKWRVS